MSEVKVSEGALGDNVSVKLTGGGGRGGLTNVAPQPGVLMDEKTNAGILTNMEKLASEINNPWRKLNEGLKDMSAWTAYNKGPAFALREEAANTDRNTLYNIRQQQAAIEAAQQQAQAEAANIANFRKGITGGGAGGAGGAGGPTPAQQQLLSAMDTVRPNQVGAQRALIDEYNKQQIVSSGKAGYDPTSLDLKDVLVFNPNTGKDELRQVNMFQYQDLLKNGLIRNPSTMYEKPVFEQAPKTTPTEIGDVLPRLQKAVFSTESSSGKADTSKPGVQGAIGPMQITSDTFDTAKRLKLIPSDYNVNNPEHNKETGNRLLAYYYNKYDKDPDKTLAAYVGGEGAINKDGSINYDRKDALGTTVGTYIDINKAKAGLRNDLENRPSGVQVAGTNKIGLPDIAAIKAEQKAKEETQVSAGKKFGESGEAMRTAFENDIEPGQLDDSYATSRRIQTLVKADPTLSGVLTGPGYAKAVGTVLEKGIGNFGIQALDDAIYQTLPNTTNLSAAERKELSTYLAKIELQAAKLIKGQGQITEGEREILQRASSSIKDPAELIYKKARAIERITEMNEQLAAIYGDGEKFTNFRKFKTDPEFKRIHSEFRADLVKILNEKVDFTRSKVGAAPATKEGAESTSKSGKPIVYRNGQWEYK